MTETWCVGDTLKNKTNNFIDYEKKNPITEKKLNLSKENVIIVVVINVKFLLIKRLEQKNLIKTQNAITVIEQLCQIQHGVI